MNDFGYKCIKKSSSFVSSVTVHSVNPDICASGNAVVSPVSSMATVQQKAQCMICGNQICGVKQNFWHVYRTDVVAITVVSIT